MVFATVQEVRAIIYTSTLTDEDIQDLINEVSKEILDRAKTTDESDELLKVAGKNAIYAAVKRKMKDTGELAARVKHGNGEQQNTPDQDIQAYEDKSSLYLRKYFFSFNARLYGRAGRGTVNNRI
jgi:hypothetical protein